MDNKKLLIHKKIRIQCIPLLLYKEKRVQVNYNKVINMNKLQILTEMQSSRFQLNHLIYNIFLCQVVIKRLKIEDYYLI